MDLRLCPPSSVNRTHVLINPTASLHCFSQLLLFHTHGCHILFRTRKRNKPPRLQLFIWPQATLQICQQIPKHQGSFGSPNPFGPYFVKQRCVLCFLINWFIGLWCSRTLVESSQTCRSRETKMTSDLLAKSFLYCIRIEVKKLDWIPCTHTLRLPAFPPHVTTAEPGKHNILCDTIQSICGL